MGIDKTKIKTQDEIDEPAPIDQVEERVEAKMKVIEAQAKEHVAHGLQDKELERKAQRLKEEGQRDLNAANEASKDSP